MATLVGFRDVDHGLGAPYAPSLHRHYLYVVERRVFGKRYYVTIDGTSRTWLGDEAALAEAALLKA